jgi:hypothetical protein
MRASFRRSLTPLAAAGLVLLLAWGLATPPDIRGVPNGPSHPGDDDLTLFRAVTDRVGRGEGYYAVMANELTTRGYPTASVANWRTPLYLELVAHVPNATRVGLGLIGVLLLFGTAQALSHVATGAWITALMFQIGVVAALWKPELLTMPEPLAGALITLSVLVTLRHWPGTSVLLGTAALFVRELAAPYVAIRFVLALSRREWREALGWALGVVGYALYFGWHGTQVHAVMSANPTSYPMSWIQFGGLQFVLATVRSNAWLTALPWWLTPFALVTALLGAWHAPLVVRLSIFGYLAAFAMIGLPVNWYWGWIPGMLLPFAWAHAVERLLVLRVAGGLRSWAQTSHS